MTLPEGRYRQSLHERYWNVLASRNRYRAAFWVLLALVMLGLALGNAR